MNNARKTKQKPSPTPLYLYIIGAAMKLTQLIKIGCKGIIRHVVELLMLAAIISIFAFAQLMDTGIVSFNITMLFVVILSVFVISLIKIKIKQGGE